MLDSRAIHVYKGEAGACRWGYTDLQYQLSICGHVWRAVSEGQSGELLHRRSRPWPRGLCQPARKQTFRALSTPTLSDSTRDLVFTEREIAFAVPPMRPLNSSVGRSIK
jgi:hypothetical protein